MPESHAQRRQHLRSRLHERELDAVLVTDLLNIRYLTGFTGSNAALLVHTADEPGAEPRTVLCTDGRYTAQAATQVPDLEHVIERISDLALAQRAGERAGQYRRTGFESGHVTVDGLDGMAAAAGDAVQLLRAPGLVEELRLVKDETEIDALRTACAAADLALADLIGQGGIRPGRSELQIARDLEARMLDHGAVGPSFDTIVAAGANSAIPHHRPTDAVLVRGDLVKMDFGALVDGYHSDMTRTVVVGEPADWQREIYELVHTAQAAGSAAVRADADVREVDAVARAVIAGAGYGEQFPHGLGHGVGLQIHEAPALSPRGDGRIRSGMAVTVEPGVYLPGQGGVRIEDTLVVRQSTAELLTSTTKELVAV
ncbi:aminopeptidase P family protein [Saccharopolyspora sp. HNM0983]|uniref:Aminopeptidase P family protein n=1 Tax=Saccharopolyspora montiporae TaxID=2781240 RepID=A0A929B707_9PSEU|nr:aminopeptidase P family protein [Saccharopolyspora sp. HNM0983]MBE9373411.1 aminopeptidase P family protein [Saccharopolyspora sp. HNM0983]